MCQLSKSRAISDYTWVLQAFIAGANNYILHLNAHDTSKVLYTTVPPPSVRILVYTGTCRYYRLSVYVENINQHGWKIRPVTVIDLHVDVWEKQALSSGNKVYIYINIYLERERKWSPYFLITNCEFFGLTRKNARLRKEENNTSNELHQAAQREVWLRCEVNENGVTTERNETQEETVKEAMDGRDTRKFGNTYRRQIGEIELRTGTIRGQT